MATTKTNIKSVTAFVYLALSLLCLPTGALSAQDTKQEVTWFSLDWQPAWINKGPLTGTGYAQIVENMLRKRLPSYQHSEQEVINVRLYSLLKNKNACFAASPYQGIDLSAQQRQGVIWSAPIHLFFYHGIIARKDSVARIKRHEKDGLVNFQSLIQDPEIKGAFQPGRAYSRWLNKIFNSDQSVMNMFRWSGTGNLTQSMFKMLEARRFDYFIDYSLMLNFHEKSTGQLGEYVYFPLAEHQGQFGLGAVACGDTPQNRVLITEINKILADIRNLPEFRNANSTWLMPKGEERLFWFLWQTQLMALEN